MLHAQLRQRGFTLIEVLVVVAIIALLIAILLPSLEIARRTSRATVCGTNLRQFGNACMAYAAESAGYVPRGGNQDSPHWIKLLPRQFGDKRRYPKLNMVPVARFPVFSCPERSRTLPRPWIDYVVNTVRQDLRARYGPDWNNIWTLGHQQIEQQGPSPINRWKMPGSVLYIGDLAMESGGDPDANTTGDLRKARENHEKVMAITDPVAQRKAAEADSGLDIIDIFKPQNMQVSKERRAGTRTHLKRFANWLHADGHVERVDWMNGKRTCEQWLHMYGALDARCGTLP